MQSTVSSGINSTYFIKYLPSLQEITPNALARVVISQLEHWFSKEDYREGGFWKYKEPCPNQFLYKAGDSWTEELGVSRKQFNSAFDTIGVRHRSKRAYLESDDPFQGKLYCSYYDRITRKTHFLRNHKLADSKLSSLSNPEKGRGEHPQPSDSFSPEEEIFNKVLHICMEETDGVIDSPVRTKNLVSLVSSAFESSFDSSFDKVRNYFISVAQDAWLMGKKVAKGFKAYFAYLFRVDVIDSVLNGKRVPFGNGTYGRSNQQQKTSLKITKEREGRVSKKETHSSRTEPTKPTPGLANDINEGIKDILQIFESETEGKLSRPKLTPENLQTIEHIFSDEFERSLPKIREYFSQVARSKWHMGEGTSGFKANFMYLMKTNVIEQFQEGRVTFDRDSQKASTQRVESKKLEMECEQLKTLLVRAQKGFRDEHSARLKTIKAQKSREGEVTKFDAYLKESLPHVYENWQEDKWNTSLIDIHYDSYLEHTYMGEEREEFVENSLKKQLPDLWNTFRDFEQHMEECHPSFRSEISNHQWSSQYVESCFKTFVKARKNERLNAAENKAA